ncbi:MULTISPECIES: group II intron maturase-specific domain-containing protein [Geobacillus]|uniref:group II intron maturase-specific domain-containing protein n=1 Tax=Geobacillus TaxID=129337 RepID=UPI001F357484|nr:group II intron maturase-specific domain-containing protein [Geobacillus genomosp. 3]
MGWIGYFRLIETPSVLQNIEGWIRRRLRLCQWLQWKRVRTRIRELRALGLKETAVMEIANTRKGAWRTTKAPQLHQALGKTYWTAQGLKSLTQRYFGAPSRLTNRLVRTRMLGGVRGRGLAAPSYSIGHGSSGGDASLVASLLRSRTDING